MNGNYFTDPNRALRYLLDKYGITGSGKITREKKAQMLSGYLQTGQARLPLLTWRLERRFVELKKLIEQKTLKEISTLRFCRIASARDQSLESLLYQEFDLCEWLTGSRICRVFAVFNAHQAVNVIVKLEYDVSGSIEGAVRLPPGQEPLDRHEIISRSGVASDRVVDTQIPQASLYAWTGQGRKSFTDTDAEIFGLEQNDVNLVRAAFKVLSEAATAAEWTAQDRRLTALVKAAQASGITGRPAAIKRT